MKFVSNLLKQHAQRYPTMELADIYKLLHQAATGAAHAAPNSFARAADAAPNSFARAAHAAPKAPAVAVHAALPSSPVPVVLDGLRHELLSMGEGPDEPLLDPISPDGMFARVHLRPYVASGRPLEALAEAFVATMQQPANGYEKLARFCGCLGDLADSGAIAFDAAQVRAYFAKLAADGYPVLRHSAAFRDIYRPAYRIVHVDLLAS